MPPVNAAITTKPQPFLHKEVETEYLRWSKMIDSSSSTTKGLIGADDVLRAHFLIVDYFMETERGIGGVGPRDLNLLHSAVYRQSVSFAGKDKWPLPLQKCATLLFGLVKDHPFHDANKRTALLVTLLCLDRQKRVPKVDQREFEDFIVDIADSKLERFSRFTELQKGGGDPEVEFIFDFLKRNTRSVDKRSYVVTYHELNQIIREHGFELVNPSGNYIDLVRVDQSRGFLNLGSPKRKERFLAQIGFPGWKRQIGRGALTTVRDATGLVAEKGYDSQVFFQGGDPLNSLISLYEGPLRRLADR